MLLKVTKTISANTKITDDMLKEVNVEYDSVPSEAIRSKSDIVDKYAKSTIYPSDFITQEKLSVIDTSSNLYSLKRRRNCCQCYNENFIKVSEW